MKHQGKTQDISIHKTDRPPSVGDDATRPDPEVREKKPRRRFTAAYKLRILKEFDACTQPGEKVATPNPCIDHDEEKACPSVPFPLGLCSQLKKRLVWPMINRMSLSLGQARNPIGTPIRRYAS